MMFILNSLALKDAIDSDELSKLKYLINNAEDPSTSEAAEKILKKIGKEDIIEHSSKHRKNILQKQEM